MKIGASLIDVNDKMSVVIKKCLNVIGYDHVQWVRGVAYRECVKLINTLGCQKFNVLEISGDDNKTWKDLRFKSVRTTKYPEFDICKDVLPDKFDLIIADQVFEHLLYPYRAAKNVYDMLTPNGYFVIITPFLIKVHECPTDCTRWTETGLKYFLAECGFSQESIVTGSWGNRKCVVANLRKWVRRGWFGSLVNEPNYPVVVWALAKKVI